MMQFVLAAAWQPVFTAINLRNATVKIKDGDSNEITVKIGDGDLNYTERRNVEYVLDLGTLDDVVEGDEIPVDVRLDFTWEYITSPAAGTPTVEDALKQRNLAAAWVSTDADVCRMYAVDIEVEHDPDCVGEDTETITLSDFRYEELDHQLRNKKVNITGKCNVTEAAIVRA